MTFYQEKINTLLNQGMKNDKSEQFKLLGVIQELFGIIGNSLDDYPKQSKFTMEEMRLKLLKFIIDYLNSNDKVTDFIMD